MRIRQCALALALIAAPLVSAAAAPPPPPPEYVFKVAKLLTTSEDAATLAQLSDYVADDLSVDVNGKPVASGKAGWMRYEAAAKISQGRVVSYSEGWKDGGTLMIVDEYDTVDRANLPPGFVADPRTATRTTLYQFGHDGKIHAIHALIAPGFWITP